MANYFRDNEDLQYYVQKGIDWESLARISERDFRDPDGFADANEALEFYTGVMEMVGEFTANDIAPHAAKIDVEGVRYEDGEAVFPERLESIFAKIRDLELHGLPVPRELGGMNAPLIVYLINSEVMGRADVSVMAHHGFHAGMAMAALVFSLREGTSKLDPETGRVQETRFRQMIDEIVSGEAWGCMDITEPDAGSDMAALRAVGEQDEDGNWFVTGEKIFITSGHGKWHFVIARTEKYDPARPETGLGGLSMFLVPTYHEREDGTRERVVALSRVEEKLGHHGSATCGLVFDRAPAQLVGKVGEGFAYMLTLMNNARLGVGFECLGLCEAAYRLAREYTAERTSMGKTIDRHEMLADYLDEMRTNIQALRAMAMDAAQHEELAQKKQIAVDHMRLDDEEKKTFKREIRRHKAAARRITPLLKYFGSEQAVWMARMTLQMHGGNGYMTEYGAEKLLRDALVMPIYEGTSQIQSLMAMKDTLGGIIKDPQGFLTRVAQARWRAVSARDPLEKRVARMQHTSLNAQQHLMMRTAGDKVRGLQGKPITEWPERFTKNWDPKRDFAFAMLHAERLLQILTDEVVAELLLAQAKRHPERRELLVRWLERAELRVKHRYEEITSTGDRLLRELKEGADTAQAAN